MIVSSIFYKLFFKDFIQFIFNYTKKKTYVVHNVKVIIINIVHKIEHSIS